VTSVTELKKGLAARLETIAGLRVHTTPPGAITPPAAVIRRAQTRYDATMARGSDDHGFVVTVFVPLVSDAHAQPALDAYLAPSGTSSIKAAIEADPSLGGVAHFARVVSAEEDRTIEYGGVVYVAVDWIVEVTASG
jgi:uncharacterized membrane protein